MDEFAFADVDADVAESPLQGIEEHQIARLQVVALYFFSSGGLLLGLARQNQPHCLLVHGAHKTTTVKTGFNGVAATPVGHTQKTKCCHHQFRRFKADFLADLFNLCQQAPVSQEPVHVVTRSRWRSVRANCQQQ